MQKLLAKTHSARYLSLCAQSNCQNKMFILDERKTHLFRDGTKARLDIVIALELVPPYDN